MQTHQVGPITFANVLQRLGNAWAAPRDRDLGKVYTQHDLNEMAIHRYDDAMARFNLRGADILDEVRR